MPAPEPLPLDYAAARAEIRMPLKPSWYMAFWTLLIAVFTILFVPITVGSGVTRMNPLAFVAGYAVWIGTILYVWLRIFEEQPLSRKLAIFIAISATVAVIFAPIQANILIGDPGYPQPRFRAQLFWPSKIVGVCLVAVAIGRWLAKRTSIKKSAASEVPEP